MNIILGRERAEELRERFTVLELDAIEHPDGKIIEAFCVISAEKVPLNELPSLEQWIRLHESLIVEYRKGNASFCEQAVEHLRGKFGGEIDTFYDHVLDALS